MTDKTFTPQEKSQEVEEIVEEFIKWAESPARPEDENSTYTQNIANWLRHKLTTLHKETEHKISDAVEKERERIVSKIKFKMAPNQPDPYTNEGEEYYDRALFDVIEMIQALNPSK